jgi:ankyrin repeat protein
MFRSKVRKLLDAACEGDNDAVLALLGKNVPIDAREKESGFTALHCAASRGHDAVVRALLSNNASINAKDNDGLTALHWAAQCNFNEDVAQTLLINGAAVDAVDDRQMTALHKTASTNMARTLLDNGATADAKDDNGDTPLHGAAFCGYSEIVKLLLSRNAAINKRNNDQKTALDLAKERGNADVVAILEAALLPAILQGVNLPPPPPGTLLGVDKPPLPPGAGFNKPPPPRDALQTRQQQPQHQHQQQQHQHQQRFALLNAAQRGENDTVRAILQYSAVDVNTDDGDKGWTSLLCAAYYGHSDVAQTLLDRGASTDKTMNGGYTALHYAAANGHSAVVRTLCNRNATIDQRTDDGQTALDLAQSKGHVDIVALLQPRQPQQHQREQRRADIAHDIDAVVAQQRGVTRATSDASSAASAAAPSAPVVLEVDWQLVMSKSGLQSKLESMQAEIAANVCAQSDLRAAVALLDKRVDANASLIAEHEKRLADLAERRDVQSAQVDILRSLQNKPPQLLFYRKLLINLEAVFLSCMAVVGGFVSLGGDAASSKALAGAAKATKVCGTVLSLLPGGALIKGAATLTAAALEQANASRRQNIVSQLGSSMSLAEASQVASDVAYRLTVVYSAQLALLAPVEQTGAASSGGCFLSFLKSTCGVGGKLVEAYVTSSGDGGEVVATAVEMAKDTLSERATELLASKLGALVGSVENGPDPFASVLADFCFVCILAELENVSACKTPNEIAGRLVHAVLDLSPTAPLSRNESGARRLLNRLRGGVKSALSNAPSRSLSVFIRAPPSASAPWCEVPVFDLLTRCGVRTKTGIYFSEAHCDTTVFGWCEASEEQAGRRGLVVVVTQAEAAPASDDRGAQLDLAFHAMMEKRLREAAKVAPPAVVVEFAAERNEFEGSRYGQCKAEDCECKEYRRPVEASKVRCDACDCAPLKHVKLAAAALGRLASRSPSPNASSQLQARR